MQITHDLALGGLQRVVVNICNAIDKDKFQMSVLCLRRSGDLQAELDNMGVETFLLPQKKNRTDYLSFMKIAKILKNQKIDIIHTHNTQPFIEGTIAALMAGVRTIVHTDHARYFPDKKRYLFAEHFVSYFAHKVVGVSDSTSEDLKQRIKIPSRKIMTIQNGINELTYAISIDKAQKRKELGILRGGPLIGLASRLVEQKGIIYLLRTMPDVIRIFPEISLIIIGEGNEKSILMDAAVQLGISDHVIFTGPRLDVPELLRLFDILVLPSLWEGLPMILLESMAAGCPIISTDVGGVSTAIKNGENGILVEPRDTDALTRAIIKLLSDESMRRKFSERSFRLFREQFTAEIMTKKYEGLYLKKI
jgi:glycosyltransferase involved in cell wall biosynthesis